MSLLNSTHSFDTLKQQLMSISILNRGWMIRAGRGGKYFDEFKNNHYVAVGWNKLGPLNQLTDDEQRRQAYFANYGNDKPAKIGNALSMIKRFGHTIEKDDIIVTYSPKYRHYLVGRDKGVFEFIDRLDDGYRQTRQVNWIGTVERDQLTQGARNQLSATLTLFALKADVVDEFLALL